MPSADECPKKVEAPAADNCADRAENELAGDSARAFAPYDEFRQKSSDDAHD
jgi:hypothetical protein